MATPPPWENDPLSRFLAEAEYNDRVVALNFPEVFSLLQAANAALALVEKAVEHDGDQGLLIPRFLIVRTRSSYLAAVRVAMSGQLAEAFPLLRAAIEQAWYALHIAKDPQPTNRAEIWLKRNDDAAAKTACKHEFTIKNVRSTHEGVDKPTAEQLSQLYETTIDFGAHPNQLGVLAAIAHSDNPNQINYQVGILNPEELPLVFTLRLAVAIAIGALKIFQQIYPTKLAMTSLQTQIPDLVNRINNVFKPWAGKI